MTEYKEIRAQRFVLVDHEGKERAVLAVDKNTGSTGLALVGDNDVVTLELATVPGGAVIVLRDGGENERLMIAGVDHGAMINLTDLGGNLGATVHVSGAGRTIGLFLDGSTPMWGKEVTGSVGEERLEDLGEA
jgi:hypothetical protein